MISSSLTETQTDIHETDYCGHPFRVSGVFDFLQPAIPSNIRLLKFDMSTDFYFNGTLIRNPKVMWDSMGASLWVISGCELLQKSYLPKWQVNIFYLSNEIFTTQNSCSQKSNVFLFKTSWLLDLLLNQGVILPMRNCRMQSVLSNLSDFFLKICLRNVNIPPDFFLNCLKLSIFLLKFCLNCFQNLSAECRYFSECFEDQCCFINVN